MQIGGAATCRHGLVGDNVNGVGPIRCVLKADFVGGGFNPGCVVMTRAVLVVLEGDGCWIDDGVGAGRTRISRSDERLVEHRRLR
jgi:hypothetical protein